MTPREISERLASRVDQVVEMLLPNGKRSSGEWCVGSTAGEEGKSLKVRLSGTKAGVWRDFSGDEGGDLLDLWAQTRGCSLSDAIVQAKEYLGINEPQFVKPGPAKEYSKPKVRAHKVAGQVLQYLTVERMLGEDALKAYSVGANGSDDTILFPYKRPDGTLCNVKHLAVARPNGKKVTRLEEGCELALFGWQAIHESSRSVVIAEGEIDAVTLWQYGRPALSVPNGATSHTWLAAEFPNLERFDDIYLCFDSDDVGKKGVRELAERLGIDRCHLVTLPRKDANKCLQDGISRDQIDAAFASAEVLSPKQIRTASSYVDDVIAMFYPPGGKRPGFSLPTGNGDVLRFRPGELIILNGINGHGKSQAAGHICLHAMAEGERAMVASMEMHPRNWLMRMTRQAAGCKDVSIPHIRKVHDWFSDRLWVYDVVGSVESASLLEAMRYARRRYGCRVFIIDSLLKCGLRDDDYSGQKAFVDMLCDFKNATDSTVFLVTHSRKTESEMRAAEPDKFDIRGAGALSDLADTVITWWRNLRKEAAIADHDVSRSMEADGIVYCHKQRQGDWQGKIQVWFDRQSYQYLSHSAVGPRCYVLEGGPSEVAGGVKW